MRQMGVLVYFRKIFSEIIRSFGIISVFKVCLCKIVCRINDWKVQKILKIAVLTFFLTITLIYLIMCILNIVVKMLKNIFCVLKERCWTRNSSSLYAFSGLIFKMFFSPIFILFFSFCLFDTTKLCTFQMRHRGFWGHFFEIVESHI